MGATLAQTEAAIVAVAPQQSTPTHPARADRIQMITVGWTDGGVQSAPQLSPPSESQVSVVVPTEPQSPCNGIDISLGTDGMTCIKPGAGESFQDCESCPEMVVVPAGRFVMGSPESEYGRSDDEGPQREVAFAEPLAISRFEVTFTEWDACVSDGGCKHQPDDAGWGRQGRPVINVSWQNITEEYLPWLRSRTGKEYRLLTEAEWEYAARSGSSTRYSFSGDDADLDDYAWYGANAHGVTHSVGQNQPNAWGLHDVHGNVAEWVQDCYVDSYKRGPRDGGAAEETTGCYRAVRDGTLFSDPQHLRSASRNQLDPILRNVSTGFRVARTP